MSEKPYTHGILAGARLLYRLMLRWSVSGADNVPREGAVLIVANHVNAADPILNLVPAERRGTLIAHKEAGEPPVYRFNVHMQGDKETVFFEI